MSMNWYERIRLAEVAEKDLGMMRDFNGIAVNVENPAGTERVGVGENGKEWRTQMKYDYGFIYSSKGEDGEGLDVYLGPDHDAEKVYVVHQNNPETNEYDEDKVMLGLPDADRAKKEYLEHYDSDDYFGSMSEIDFEEFKDIVATGSRDKVSWKRKGKKVK